MKTEKNNSAYNKTEILIVEDSLTQATQIKRLLESNHYKVSVSINGKQAMDLISKHKPSLVISDIMMPEMNGYELCKKIKSNKNTEDIPMILLTILSDPEEIIEGLSCGADSFITKPYNEKYLLSHIEKILSEKNGEDHKKMPFDVQILFKGKKRFIQAEQQNVIKLILDIYEGAIQQNGKLVQTQEELRLLNERLESMVEDRTSDLSEEIKLSNQIANRLKESEERFRTQYNNALVGLYRTNSQGEILLANRALVKMLGFQSIEELTARNIKEIGYGPSYQRQQFIDQIEKEGEVKDLEAIWICHDGKEILVMESAKANYNSDGKILYYDGTVQDITEQKRAAETLNKIQHLFETLALVSPVGIFRTDPEGNTTYVNPKYLELSGLSSEEAYGNGWLNAVHPEDRGKLSETWLNDLKSKNESSAEYRFVEPDGSIIWVIGKAVPELIGNEVIGYIGTITDITDRKHVEDRLRSSEERLKILFEYAPDAYYLNDLKGNIIDGNIAAEKLLGYDKNELIGKNLLKLNLLSLEQLPRAAKLLVKSSLGKAAGPDEFVLNRKDESKVTVEIITHPVKIKDQTLVLGIARDISERKRTEKVIRESEEKYRSIFENVQDVYYETSIDGTILEVSPSIEILSKGQYRMDDLIGKSIFDFYSESKERQALLTVLQERGAIMDYEITLKNRDGSHVPCSISSKICFDDQGRPEKIIGSIHDITDRKNATEKLKLAKEKAEASDNLKTAFLNNISHEVRTPLNGILGFAEIMSQTELSEKEKKDSLSMLHDSSDRLLETITNYMDISLITSGSMTVHNKDFVPGQVLREIYDHYKTICSDRKLELFLKIPGQAEDLSVNSDPEIFRKIVSHLLNNAIKFTEKGSIDYGYCIHDEELEFFVKDTGIGISKESSNNIFERFVKGDRGPTRFTEGSGLGLSIAKGMTDIIGGNIRVESELGVGSCFYFTIALLKNTEIISSVTSGSENIKIKSGAIILVAEDDDANFYYLNAILKHETGATILHASNGREAIELFKANPDIILILMDIKMPEIDGLEATRQIKLLKKEVPIIAITAYAMLGDEEKILAAGCDSYLSKPISKKSLLEKMAEYINI